MTSCCSGSGDCPNQIHLWTLSQKIIVSSSVFMSVARFHWAECEVSRRRMSLDAGLRWNEGGRYGRSIASPNQIVFGRNEKLWKYAQDQNLNNREIKIEKTLIVTVSIVNKIEAERIQQLKVKSFGSQRLILPESQRKKNFIFRIVMFAETLI